MRLRYCLRFGEKIVKLNLAIIATICAFLIALFALYHLGKPVPVECGIVIKGHAGQYCVKHDSSGNYYESDKFILRVK